MAARMDEKLKALLQRFAERGEVLADGRDGKPPRLRTAFAGVRAMRSKLSPNRMRELAYAAGVPLEGSGEPGAWEPSDAERVVAVAFTDEGLDRHHTIFPADWWRFDSFLRNPVVLLNHNAHAAPIGLGLLIERKRITGADGKKRDGWILHTLFSREDLNPEAEVAFRNVMAGRLRGASHSFDLRNVRYADEGDAKKYGVPLDTPMLEAELLEVSVVTVGSNPNVGPGRSLAHAEAKAIAEARTAAGEQILNGRQLRAIYGTDACTAIEVGDTAGAVTLAELERIGAEVEAALRGLEGYQPRVLGVEDLEAPIEHTATKRSGTDLLTEMLSGLLSGARSETSKAVDERKSVVVDGKRYILEGDLEVVERRRALLVLAARALAAATADEVPDLAALVRLEGEAELREALTGLREEMAEFRKALAALDPLGSVGGGRMASAMLGHDLGDRLRETARVTSESAAALAS